MVKIKGGGIDYLNLISVIIKYGTLLTLLWFSVYYIHNPNIQFIVFIIILILIILGSAILFKDLNDLSSFDFSKITDTDNFSLEKTNPIFLQLFMLVIGIAVFMKIISLTFLIVTFSNGRKELKKGDYSKIKQLSSHNLLLLNNYIEKFIYSILLLISLSLLCFIMYGDINTQILTKNLTGIMIAISIIILISFEMYDSVQFLKIKDNNGLLYEISVPDTNE